MVALSVESLKIQQDMLTLYYNPRPSCEVATQMIRILAGYKAVSPERVLLDSTVQMAAQRMIGVFAMAVGVITGLAALPYLFTTTLGFVLMSAIGVSLFAAGHDLFVMANNLQHKIGLQTDQVMASIAANNDNSRAVVQQLTNETFLQPLLVARLTQQAMAAVPAAARA